MSDDRFIVRLLAAPAAPMLELLAVIDALHREVQVVAFDEGSVNSVDRSVHDALVIDREHLEVPRNAIHDQAAAARGEGRATIDIAAPYRRDEVPRVLSAAAAVGAADEAAQRGELLAPSMTDAQRHLWRWTLREFETQAAGGEPTPYIPLQG